MVEHHLVAAQGEAAMPADQASETAAGPMDPASTQDGPADAGSSDEAMPQEGSDAMGGSSGEAMPQEGSDAMGESSGDGDAMGESSGDGDAMGGSEAASEPAWGVLTGFLILTPASSRSLRSSGVEAPRPSLKGADDVGSNRARGVTSA